MWWIFERDFPKIQTFVFFCRRGVLYEIFTGGKRPRRHINKERQRNWVSRAKTSRDLIKSYLRNRSGFCERSFIFVNIIKCQSLYFLECFDRGNNSWRSWKFGDKSFSKVCSLPQKGKSSNIRFLKQRDINYLTMS